MKTFKLVLTVMLFAVIFTGISYAQQSYSFNEGLNVAKSQNKLIVINIYNETDRWCQKMEKEVYSNADVQKNLASFVYIKLNSGSGDVYTYNGKEMSASELTKILGVMSYPTHVFMKPDGTVINFLYNGVESSSLPGFLDAEDFISTLNYFKEGKNTSVDLSTIL